MIVSTLGAQAAKNPSYDIPLGTEIFRIFGLTPPPASASAKRSSIPSNAKLLRTVTALLRRGSDIPSKYDVMIERSSRCGNSERNRRNDPTSPRRRETDKDRTDSPKLLNASSTCSSTACPPHQYVSRKSSMRVNDLRCSADENLCDHWSQPMCIHNFLTCLDKPSTPG